MFSIVIFSFGDFEQTNCPEQKKKNQLKFHFVSKRPGSEAMSNQMKKKATSFRKRLSV
jgi:hypothetical protein